MKNSVKKAVALIVTMASLGCMGCVNAFAAQTTVTVAANQTWSDLSAVSRTGQYSYVAMRNLAVYPTYGGTDNFRYIQGNAKNSSGNQICNILTLDEQSGSASYPTIYEGYLNTSSVIFRFRGNSPNYGATAAVVYNAL